MSDVNPAPPSPEPSKPQPPPDPTFPAPEIPPGIKPRARPGRLVHPDQASPGTFTPEQRVMVWIAGDGAGCRRLISPR
jgi:hypothetical protein